MVLLWIMMRTNKFADGFRSPERERSARSRLLLGLFPSKKFPFLVRRLRLNRNSLPRLGSPLLNRRSLPRLRLRLNGRNESTRYLRSRKTFMENAVTP